MLNYFIILGVELDASIEHVKKAFRTLAKQWHPDKNPNPGAEDKFKEIKAAYEYLQSDDRRGIHAAEIRRNTAEQIRANDVFKPHAFKEKRAHESPGTQSGNTSGDSVPENVQRSASANSSHRGFKQEPRSDNRKSSKTTSAEKEDKRGPRTSRRGKVDPKLFRRDFPAEQPSFEFMFDFMQFDTFIDDFMRQQQMFEFPSNFPRRNSLPKKSKARSDPFGNPLPENVDSNIYDWSQPRCSPSWTDFGDPQFFCHYCGRLMTITLLQRHEPKCARLGSSRRSRFLDPHSFVEDENVIQKTRVKTSHPAAPKGEKVVECRWCGRSFAEAIAAAHVPRCRKQAERLRESATRKHSDPMPRPPGETERPPWNSNFSDNDNCSEEPRTHSAGESSSYYTSSGLSSKRFEAKGPSVSQGCTDCVVKYGINAKFSCSCGVSKSV